ncbi:hypothetical protein [Streptomyces sp. SID10815]|uniref:hypothetical protein n=1 Tax=Streptomyces sp. SID10815 TaxID=2706027 RepID=UPI0013C77B4A|nr:hypothetical protein [Streptomyces sp. SID10815]NEA50433.1 hypothetical protein [Streptomyces sp. SID10815]
MTPEPCVECGDAPELLDEDLTCGPCRIQIHLGATVIAEKTVTIRFEIEEVVTCDVEAKVTVPADIAEDDDALLSWLEDNDDAWVDDIDPLSQQVAERSVTSVYGADL